MKRHFRQKKLVYGQHRLLKSSSNQKLIFVKLWFYHNVKREKKIIISFLRIEWSIFIKLDPPPPSSHNDTLRKYRNRPSGSGDKDFLISLLRFYLSLGKGGILHWKTGDHLSFKLRWAKNIRKYLDTWISCTKIYWKFCVARGGSWFYHSTGPQVAYHDMSRELMM